MTKFKDTIFWKEYYRYTRTIHECSMRSTVDAYLIYKLLQHYKFKNILEIGFFEGQTAGLIAELSDTYDGSVVTVDPAPKMNIFNSIYSHSLNIDIVMGSSTDYKFDNYDLILIDGSPDNAEADLSNSFASISREGLVIVSNKYPIIHDVTADFIPIISTHQSLIFSHPSIDRSNFIDDVLPHKANNFINFSNKTDDNNNTILHMTTLPVFTDMLKFFNMALETYDL